MSTNTTKTPYEIRLELLQMSKDYFETIQNANLDMMRSIFERSIEAAPQPMNAEATKKMIESFSQGFKPTYSFEDVIKKATEMYSFVNDKK
jgi:hypothetical protein